MYNMVLCTHSTMLHVFCRMMLLGPHQSLACPVSAYQVSTARRGWSQMDWIYADFSQHNHFYYSFHRGGGVEWIKGVGEQSKDWSVSLSSAQYWHIPWCVDQCNIIPNFAHWKSAPVIHICSVITHTAPHNVSHSFSHPSVHAEPAFCLLHILSAELSVLGTYLSMKWLGIERPVKRHKQWNCGSS